MSGKQYWKNKIPYVTGNFLAMAVLAVFLLLGGNTRDSVLFILGSWLVILAVSMGAAYMCRRKQMDTLLESVNQLEEKYLIAEVTGLPERAQAWMKSVWRHRKAGVCRTSTVRATGTISDSV